LSSSDGRAAAPPLPSLSGRSPASAKCDVDQLLAGGALGGAELGRCWPSASSKLRAPFCARRAAFFARRRVARARRCLAWIFLRRESVILGVGLHPLFVPSGELPPVPRVPSELVALEHFDFIEHFDAHDRPEEARGVSTTLATRAPWVPSCPGEHITI